MYNICLDIWKKNTSVMSGERQNLEITMACDNTSLHDINVNENICMRECASDFCFHSGKYGWKWCFEMACNLQKIID